MRYDTPVYFQEITPGEYDPETGKNITVVECNAEYQAMKAGTAVVTAKA